MSLLSLAHKSRTHFHNIEHLIYGEWQYFSSYKYLKFRIIPLMQFSILGEILANSAYLAENSVSWAFAYQQQQQKHTH